MISRPTGPVFAGPLNASFGTILYKNSTAQSEQ